MTKQDPATDELHLLKRQVRQLRLIVGGMCLALVAVVATGMAGEQIGSFSEIDVERINVREADGRLALVIANSERIPAGTYQGEEILPPRHQAGMIFFNHEETESGGLVYTTGEYEGRRYGLGHLSFDQYNQNQVLALEYNENIHGHYRSGLKIVDRPKDITFKEVIDLQTRASNGDEEARARFEELDAAGLIGEQRVFVGSRDTDAILELNDRLGRPRLVVHVDASGEARIDFLDEEGEVVRSLSPAI